MNKATDTDPFQAGKKADQRILTVPERIVQFVDHLRTVDRKRMFPEVMKEIRDLKAHYTLRYVRVALSRYREAVREAFGDGHPALAYLHSFRNDINAYNKADRGRVFAQHLGLKPLDADEFIERALGQLNSTSYSRAVAALLLLTGRRPVEICYSGEFAVIPDRDDVLLFAGQAKAKGTEKPPYHIPVLADSREIFAALEVLRVRFTFQSKADVNSKKGKEIGDAVSQVFGSDYSAQELRKVYAAIAYHDYDQSDPRPRLSEPAYLASILGHGDGDVQTALSYMAYYVDGDFDRTLRNFQNGMRDMLPTLEERYRVAEPKNRPFIEADMQKARALAGDVAAPVPTESDLEELKRFSDAQRALLTKVARGDATFSGFERWTVEALQRRDLLRVTIDRSKRFVEPTLELTARGAELAAILSAQNPAAAVS